MPTFRHQTRSARGRALRLVATARELAARKFHIRSFDLDSVDLTRSAGKLQLRGAAVAICERERIREPSTAWYAPRRKADAPRH